MHTNKRQTIDNNNSTTNNRFDAMADETVDYDIAFHQSGRTDDEMTNDQQHTPTVDGANTTTTNVIGFHQKTDLVIFSDLTTRLNVLSGPEKNLKYVA